MGNYDRLSVMLPVLFSFGPLVISSFGFFLALSFLYSTFLAWRLARAWDLDEEKVLDICLLTFFGGLIGARILFVLFNLSIFIEDPIKISLLTKYPGLSFWGGLLGGGLALYFFVRRVKKINFWQVADLASVGLLGGLVLGNIGCFLGGCNVGVESSLPLTVSMVGYLGKRFPTQILEAITFTIILWKIWPMATHFHFTGKIASLSLILLGFVEVIFNPFKDILVLEWIFPILTFSAGVFSFYYLSKKSILADLTGFLGYFLGVFTNKKVRKHLLNFLLKSWYNQKVALRWNFYRLKKKSLSALRRRRVKPTTGNI